MKRSRLTIARLTALLALVMLVTKNPGAGFFALALAEVLKDDLSTPTISNDGIVNFGANFATFNSTLTPGFELAYPNITGVSIPARDITYYPMICKRKVATQGGGRSKGRKCSIGNKMYFMKYDLNNDRLLEYYNLMLTQKFGIEIPKVEFIFNKKKINGSLGNLLIASESIDGYLSGYDLGNSKTQTSFRKFTSFKIGEIGIARLTVAQGFIGDLYSGNWGSNGDNKLVLMDVDGGLDDKGNSKQPHTLGGYLALASNIRYNSKDEPEKNTDQLSLSVNNIIEMRRILDSFTNLSTPKLHNSVDMSDAFFQALVSLYIMACDMTLLNTFNNSALNKPSSEVNDELAKALKALAVTIDSAKNYHQLETNLIIPGLPAKVKNTSSNIMETTAEKQSQNIYPVVASSSTAILQAGSTNKGLPQTEERKFSNKKPVAVTTPSVSAPSVAVLGAISVFGVIGVVGLFARKRNQSLTKNTDKVFKMPFIPKVRRSQRI